LFLKLLFIKEVIKSLKTVLVNFVVNTVLFLLRNLLEQSLHKSNLDKSFILSFIVLTLRSQNINQKICETIHLKNKMKSSKIEDYVRFD
jgi:hypothetical protein